MNYESGGYNFGSRADFWVGVGPGAEWLGSVPYDGNQWRYPSSALQRVVSEQDYRECVACILAGDKYASKPSDGWPWPWDTSEDTDFVYTWVNGRVEMVGRTDWPDMSGTRPITLGVKSGTFVVD